MKEARKELKILSNTMDTSGEVVILVKYSPKQEQKLESIKVKYEED